MPASQEEIVTTLQEKIDRVAGEDAVESSPDEKPSADEEDSTDAGEEQEEKSKHLQTRKLGIMYVLSTAVEWCQMWPGHLYSSLDPSSEASTPWASLSLLPYRGMLYQWHLEVKM